MKMIYNPLLKKNLQFLNDDYTFGLGAPSMLTTPPKSDPSIYYDMTSAPTGYVTSWIYSSQLGAWYPTDHIIKVKHINESISAIDSIQKEVSAYNDTVASGQDILGFNVKSFKLESIEIREIVIGKMNRLVSDFVLSSDSITGEYNKPKSEPIVAQEILGFHVSSYRSESALVSEIVSKFCSKINLDNLRIGEILSFSTFTNVQYINGSSINEVVI